MHPLVAFLLNALALYAAVGVVTALAFVDLRRDAGAARAVSLGARILILPGAAALWPYVLLRWIRRRAMTRGHRTFHRLLWPVLAVDRRARLHAWRWSSARRPSRPQRAQRAGADANERRLQAVQWNRRKFVYDAS